jgi:hypothetical protein
MLTPLFSPPSWLSQHLRVCAWGGSSINVVCRGKPLDD